MHSDIAFAAIQPISGLQEGMSRFRLLLLKPLASVAVNYSHTLGEPLAATVGSIFGKVASCFQT